MFERFTKSARLVVEDAMIDAQRLGSREVRPEHLFAALVADDDSAAVRSLVAMGPSVREWRAALAGLRSRFADGLDAGDAEALAVLGIDLSDVARRLDPGPQPRRRKRPRFARSAKKALELSLREALRLGDGYIGSEHLLLGLVATADRTVLDTLAAFDLSADDVREAVATMERRAG